MEGERKEPVDLTYRQAVRHKVRSIVNSQISEEDLKRQREKARESILKAIDEIGEISPDEVLDRIEERQAEAESRPQEK